MRVACSRVRGVAPEPDPPAVASVSCDDFAGGGTGQCAVPHPTFDVPDLPVADIDNRKVAFAAKHVGLQSYDVELEVVEVLVRV